MEAFSLDSWHCLKEKSAKTHDKVRANHGEFQYNCQEFTCQVKFHRCRESKGEERAYPPPNQNHQQLVECS